MSVSTIKDKLSVKKSSSSSNSPERSPSSSQASSRRSSAEHAANDRDFLKRKYLLKVTAGPSYDASTHSTVPVNTNTALAFENEHMTAKVKVRIRNYQGLPKGSPEMSAYFDDPMHKNDQYSIDFSFVPKHDLPAEDIVWGNDFEHPVRDRLPPTALFNTAFSIVKRFVDPGLECDAYADKPWLFGPALGCWFTFRIGDKIGEKEPAAVPHSEEADVVNEGADGEGKEIREKLGLPENNEKRRKHFLNAENRKKFTFEEGRLYQGDFFNPYLDFGKFALKLPGFSLSVLKYINDKTHSLRYTCKNVKTGEVYFVVVFTLLFGDDIKVAVEEDNRAGNGVENKDAPNGVYVDQGVD